MKSNAVRGSGQRVGGYNRVQTGGCLGRERVRLMGHIRDRRSVPGGSSEAVGQFTENGVKELGPRTPGDVLGTYNREPLST